MIKGATIFAVGSACGLIVGTFFGAIIGIIHEHPISEVESAS